MQTLRHAIALLAVSCAVVPTLAAQTTWQLAAEIANGVLGADHG